MQQSRRMIWFILINVWENMMSKLSKITALCMSAVMLFGCSGCSYFFEITEDESAEKFDVFCDRIVKETIEDSSLNAHYMVTNPKDYGVIFTEEDYTLGEINLNDADEDYKELKATYDELKSFNYSTLTDEQQLTYDILSDYIEKQLAYEGTDEIVNLFAPNNGLISNLSTNFIEYQFYDAEDVEQYLMILKSVETYMDSAFEFTKDQAEKGYFMADELADIVIEMCETYIDAENEPLLITFEDKINKLDLTEEEKVSFIKMNEEYVEKYYLPIYQKTIDLIEELKGTGINDGGLAGYGKIGVKYYEAIVAEKTSSDMTPEDVAEYLDEAMEDVWTSLTTMYLMDEEAYMSVDTYQPDFDTPNEVTEFLLDNITDKFPVPYTENYAIEYQNPACEIEGTLAYYVSSRIDDISINNIKVNGSAVEGDSLTMYLTLAHEGYPGHLYQFTAAYGSKDIPTVRKILDFIGVTEGWAEYSSNICTDYLSISDNLEEMIYLNDIFSYIVCSRLDIGVNYEGWSMEDAYDYLSEYIMCDDETVKELYYDVVGDPGLFLPYTVGHLKMRELRETAEDELGKKFDEKEYHQFLIDLGLAPFGVIEDELEKWLAKQ